MLYPLSSSPAAHCACCRTPYKPHSGSYLLSTALNPIHPPPRFPLAVHDAEPRTAPIPRSLSMVLNRQHLSRPPLLSPWTHPTLYTSRLLAVHGAEAPQHLSCPLSTAHGAERRTPPVPDRYPRCCTKYSSHSPLAVYGAEPSAPLLFPCSLPTMLPPHCHSLSMVLNPVLLPSSLTSVHDAEPRTAPIPRSLSMVLNPICLSSPDRYPRC